MSTLSLRPRLAFTVLALLVLSPWPAFAQKVPGSFTIEQVRSNPFPSELVTAPSGARVAWVFNAKGLRNIWVAEAPDFKARQVTDYRVDDGQELTYLSFSPDGRTVVYVRGGDHGANWSAEGNLAPDPLSSAVQPKVEIWSVAVSGVGAPKRLAEGDEPVISSRGDRVAFTSNHQIWVMPLDGSSAPKRFFFARGESTSPVWSPSGDRLAFVSERGDHAFIGVVSSDSEPVRWIAPTTSRDLNPHWSPDGARLAFVRVPGSGGPPETLLEQHPIPWAIWSADVASGAAHPVWKSPVTLLGSYPRSQGHSNLHWAAGNRIVFLADMDGWEHLYSVSESGGEPLLLTPGKFMTEYIDASPDGKLLVYAANSGADSNDIDRRHIFKVPVDRAVPVALTPGDGVEWTPAVTGDGRSVAFIGAGVKRPPLPMVIPMDGGKARTLAEDQIPADFPAAELVAPRKVVFKAADGVEVHGQLFERAGGSAKKPAVIYVHGGPPRQMLLGWHYMYYYSNSYAMNQYLASRGYVVLSVNYRLGIGYGHNFHHPDHAGPWGAAEYQDVKAGGEYLRTLSSVDPKRIGIWGGSYGGYLTALALARNSDIFAAGVDLHGVHDFTGDGGRRIGGGEGRYEKGDSEAATEVAWKSSPVASISTWKSPVLLIHGDDDRNVRFHQTVDLARRLAAAGVSFEELVIPDEIHDFLRHASWLVVNHAMVDYFDRQFGMRSAGEKTATSRGQ
ncbi:MAG: prolyl oligopeptidase family serine peptidase [Gemmatimonadota bacterium]|nr:prolyl oligopeptidase family serine peptidase [Gemmatimonadota bacterium]